MLTWNAIAAFSEEHVAKFVYQVLLLYLVVSSALERQLLVAYEESCKALLMAAINFRLELLALIVLNNNHGRSLPTL